MYESPSISNYDSLGLYKRGELPTSKSCSEKNGRAVRVRVPNRKRVAPVYSMWNESSVLRLLGGDVRRDLTVVEYMGVQKRFVDEERAMEYIRRIK